MAEYPKSVFLKDKTPVVLRPLVKEDEQKLYSFFKAVPLDDRLYLKEDVTKESTIQKWIAGLDYDKVFPIIALHDHKIVADATLHFREYGWMRYLGEIRLLVARDYQRKGLGTLLIGELVNFALNKGLHRLQAQFTSGQISVIKAFEKFGFNTEAVLKKQVVDLQGNEIDMVIMTNDVTELWRKMEDIFFDYDVKRFD
jgi:RimJ/RimL family protein N-acetyltransferase